MFPSLRKKTSPSIILDDTYTFDITRWNYLGCSHDCHPHPEQLLMLCASQIPEEAIMVSPRVPCKHLCDIIQIDPTLTIRGLTWQIVVESEYHHNPWKFDNNLTPWLSKLIIDIEFNTTSKTYEIRIRTITTNNHRHVWKQSNIKTQYEALEELRQLKANGYKTLQCILAKEKIRKYKETRIREDKIQAIINMMP